VTGGTRAGRSRATTFADLAELRRARSRQQIGPLHRYVEYLLRGLAAMGGVLLPQESFWSADSDPRRRRPPQG
jgi:hypothetical protein